MNKELKVSPSIAAGNLMRLEDEVRKLEMSGADSIHFDVMDGHFVPLLTIGIPFIEQMRKITSMHLDVHIMVTNPDFSFENYLAAGADTLSFHIETSLHPHRICTKIKDAGKRAGIALNPATHWKDIEYLLPTLDQVTLMTVNPGFSRQAHIPSVHKKILELSKFRGENNLKFDIMIDGGVSHENANTLAKLGVDIVVAGGAVFNFEDYKEAIAKIKKASSSN
ncbi:ribulose-phosphate 3-epimerase [Fluviispira multicolorata]|uniref:Ribulose-phosphate 3-epimerase n=1 Tax=Fluviispira multicolorata TaxID=2654512 RepID=A0A833JCV1_9BACT|nr:ribulose-phosphate 3-epimerase [Fluviispira multicolorata]KAB8030941.1 ribulose-phosphate 3-epimerase [Fluviispira multicolorata]